MSDYDPSFEPTSDPASAEESERFESLNVCRAAALGAAFGPERPLVGLAQELASMGLPRSLDATTWDWREAELRVDLVGIDSDASRPSIFSQISEGARPETVLAFLTAVLVSPLERESAAAAAAIYGASGSPIFQGDWRRRWWGDSGLPRSYEPFLHYLFGPSTPEAGLGDPDDDTGLTWNWFGPRWREFTQDVFRQPRALNGDVALRLRLLSEWRLALAIRSQDSVTRELAVAALARIGHGADDAKGGGTGRAPMPGAVSVSTIIHGTWGWKGDWWRPAASFHDYVGREVRSNIYSRGAPFSWSGAYSNRQRCMAAEDFHRWAEEISPRGIDTLFGHSYGGEVATRAWRLGTKINEVVLLSTPATAHVRQAVEQGLSVVDVRLPFDPVLAVARVQQRMRKSPQRIRVNAPNLNEVVLRNWRLSHGATHDPDVWQAEDLVQRARL